MCSKTVLVSTLFALFCSTGCDSGEPAAEPQKSKSVSELKQAPKKEMSKEELEEARRKAGFKSREEQLEEAKAVYETMEKGFVKGRLEAYRGLAKDLRTAVDGVEKSAAKWAKAKDPDAAFGKWNEKYTADNKAFMTAYRELTEKESRGGNVQVTLGGLITQWENFNGDLGGKIAEAEGFGPTLEALRKGLDGLDKQLDEIEKDESIEADPAPDGADDKKKKKKSKKK